MKKLSQQWRYAANLTAGDLIISLSDARVVADVVSDVSFRADDFVHVEVNNFAGTKILPMKERVRVATMDERIAFLRGGVDALRSSCVAQDTAEPCGEQEATAAKP